MNIIIGKTAGFCFGVKNAVNNVEKKLEKNNKVYCLGELVHNKQVTEELINKGAIFIENIEEAKNNVIIRAHGATKEIYEKAKKMNINVTDLTCPKVLKIHDIAKEYSEKKYFIFLVGQREHPETIGTISFCGKDSIIIENIEDVAKGIEKFKNTHLKQALIISQTTYSLEKLNEITDKIKEAIPNVEVKNTICSATKQRQEETEKISKIVDAMIIVGGKNSSNSNKLYELAKKNCKIVYFIETQEELDIKKIKTCETIGIMAGASTPQKSIDNLVDIIKKI